MSREGRRGGRAWGPGLSAGGHRTWTGHEGWRQALAHMRSMFDDFTIEFHETIDVDDDRVVLVYTQTGTGYQSGARASRERMAFLHTVADGKIVHTVTFSSVEDALANASGR